jgi:hypothetical protein
MRFRTLAVLLLAPTLLAAQTVVNQQVQVGSSRQAGAPEQTKPPTKEQLQRGRQMLELAEASANGMDGGMRAYGLMQVANAYAPTDKKKALQLLDNALAATHALDDDRSQWQTRDELQSSILRAMVPLEPSKADALLDQVSPGARGDVVNALLSYYQKQKDWDRAISIIYRIAPDQAIPYGAVAQIIKNLPEDRSGDAVQLFSTALTNFKNHPQPSGRMAIGGDFPSLILSSWKTLPKETVLEAINAVLSQAKQPAQDDSSGQPQPMSVSMASANGAVQFNSIYEFRLFQLLPVLKELDPSKADELVKQDQSVKAALNQYPQGEGSIAPPASGSKGGPGGAGAPMMSMMMGAPSGGGAGKAPSGQMSPLLMREVAKVVEDAAKHPDDALASAGAIPDVSMRTRAYMGIAQVCAKTHASVTRQALEKVLDSMDGLDVMQQAMNIGSIAKLYLELDDTASAKKAIEKGMEIAEKAYKQDTNSDDPNKALEAYWPSADVYRNMLRTAAKISAPWALDLLKDISDPQMKGMGQIALAQSLLDIPPGETTIQTQTASGKNMMMKSISQ